MLEFSQPSMTGFRVRKTAGEVLMLLKSVEFMHGFNSQCCATAFSWVNSHGLKCILGQITSQTLYGRQEYFVLSEASALVFEKNFT